MSEESQEMPALDLDGLIKEAQKNEAANWALIEESLTKLELGWDYLRWAINIGLSDDNEHVRDLAATMLDISSYPLDERDVEKVQAAMEADSYNIVRYRLAVALYKRGDDHIGVEHMMKEAMHDKDVGELARAEWAKRNPAPDNEIATTAAELRSN